METKTTKSEILESLKKLKDKGVNVIIHDSFIDRGVSNGFTINSGSFVTPGVSIHHSNNNDVVLNIKTLKKANELSIHIYQNSSEEEIQNQIGSISNHLKRIEDESKSTAIVDFLRGELDNINHILTSDN